jgi:hypothetical protein
MDLLLQTLLPKVQTGRAQKGMTLQVCGKSCVVVWFQFDTSS